MKFTYTVELPNKEQNGNTNFGNSVQSVVWNSEGPHLWKLLNTIFNRKSIRSFVFVRCIVVVRFSEGGPTVLKSVVV